ncbi:differentially expressed in FDCP 8 homolog A [Patella vulgata]|uniref:differentially expressed in FDCP 8 homolog A n=1 Tax=Patella vulgata TaxID=6465 RepID=UPI00217FAD05|nr:differentially expressed in FDCP 8 homolog A [Patella vulgata]
MESERKMDNKYHRIETKTAVVKMTGAVLTEASQFESDDESQSNEASRLLNGAVNSKMPTNSWQITSDKQPHNKLKQPSNIGKNISPVNKSDRDLNSLSSPSSRLYDVSASPEKQLNRFNPFDRDLNIDDEYFDDFKDNYFLTPDQEDLINNTRSESFCSNEFTPTEDGNSDSEEITFADLGLAEDHFSHPEGHFGLSSQEELELAISACKHLIKAVQPNSDKYKNLVKKLIQLRLKKQELKEGPDNIDPEIKAVTGHRFKEKQSSSSKYYCEKCNGVIWGMIQQWYRCLDCGYSCHVKCLNQITRTCAKLKVEENPTYWLSICPQKSLASQNYRCFECRQQVSYRTGSNVPRLCDYSGQSYCEYCHWNDTMVIPARVLHNWDFEPKKVSRASKQFLRLMYTRAVIRINDINPMLFNFVDELNEIKKLREELLIMKKYILICPQAMELKLLRELSSRQHFVESSDIYSMKDLMEVQSDALLSEIAHVHSTWAQHIKTDCERCQGRGFVCELCKDSDVLFPFDNIAVVCSQCSNVLHRHCFAQEGKCPRCKRRERRKDD